MAGVISGSCSSSAVAVAALLLLAVDSARLLLLLLHNETGGLTCDEEAAAAEGNGVSLLRGKLKERRGREGRVGFPSKSLLPRGKKREPPLAIGTAHSAAPTGKKNALESNRERNFDVNMQESANWELRCVSGRTRRGLVGNNQRMGGNSNTLLSSRRFHAPIKLLLRFFFI